MERLSGSPATTASGLVLRGTSGTLARIASTGLGVGSAVVAGGVTAFKVESGVVSAVYIEVRKRIRPCVVDSLASHLVCCVGVSDVCNVSELSDLDRGLSEW
jgi:hypothetical protein